MEQKGLAWIKLTSQGVNSPISKFINDEAMNRILSKMDARTGDLILFVADRDKIVFDSLGHVRIDAAKKLDLLKKDEYKLLYVTKFPQLNMMKTIIGMLLCIIHLQVLLMKIWSLLKAILLKLEQRRMIWFLTE